MKCSAVRRWSVCVALLWLPVSGCVSMLREARQDASSGFLGCPPREIVLTDERGATWTASCRGKRHYCSSAGDVVACALEQGTPASATPGGAAPTEAVPIPTGTQSQTGPTEPGSVPPR